VPRGEVATGAPGRPYDNGGLGTPLGRGAAGDGCVPRRAGTAAFAAALKDAVDLDSIRGNLAGVVQQTLDPAHVSVWISPRG
jgi:hypothetical protein